MAASVIYYSSPARGVAAGGNVVQVVGTGFVAASTVKFGATAAASVRVRSSFLLDATTPAGTAGPVAITVDAIVGPATGYTYV